MAAVVGQLIATDASTMVGAGGNIKTESVCEVIKKANQVYKPVIMFYNALEQSKETPSGSYDLHPLVVSEYQTIHFLDKSGSNGSYAQMFKNDDKLMDWKHLEQMFETELSIPTKAQQLIQTKKSYGSEISDIQFTVASIKQYNASVASNHHESYSAESIGSSQFSKEFDIVPRVYGFSKYLFQNHSKHHQIQKIWNCNNQQTSILHCDPWRTSPLSLGQVSILKQGVKVYLLVSPSKVDDFLKIYYSVLNEVCNYSLYFILLFILS